MKRRLLRTLAIGLLASSIFVGCSNTNTANTPDSQVAEEEGSEENSETQSEAIEASTSMDETNVDYTGKTTLTYIGHASVKIVSKDGTVLYIDPQYEDGNYDDEADYILVTHGHDDHQPNDKVTLKDGGKLITYVETHYDDVYESYDFGSIQVETVAAGGNLNHNIKNCVGYIVTVDGIKVYHAGDTSMIDQMNDLTAK